MERNKHFCTLKQHFSADDLEAMLVVDYADDDIIIIDSVKDVTEFKPVKVEMNTIVMCLKGHMQCEINGKVVGLAENEIIVTPPCTTMKGILFSSDYECRVVCLSTGITQALIRPYINVWNKMLYLNRVIKLRTPVRSTEVNHKMIDNLKEFFEGDKDNIYFKAILKALLQALLLGLCNLIEWSEQTEVGDAQPNTASIFHRFLDLLNQNGDKRHSVMYYSDKLCISTKYLSSVCKICSGKTAKRWIEEYTMENVRYYLRFTDYSIKEISDILNFPNASYLGRYVKTHFGVTPMAYRKGAGDNAQAQVQ